METQRIILKDKNLNKFRICHFGIDKDKYGEDYLKFCFPDLKDKIAFSSEGEEIIVNKDDNIIEFSSHFLVGKSHFKTKKQDRLLKNESRGHYKNTILIHLLSYIIHDLSHFAKYEKDLENFDYEIDSVFSSKKGKILEFYLQPDSGTALFPARKYEDLTLIKLHPFSNGHYRLLLMEFEFNEKDEKKSGISLFRKYNQAEEFIEVDLSKFNT